MMTGELDYESTFLTQPSESSVLCIFILVVFIVLVYIILSNLLVGLAVSDMYAIQHRSEVLRLTRHVELMVQVETLFRSRLIPQKMQQCLLNSISIISSKQKPSVSIYPNLSLGFSDSLFLFLSRMIGTRRLLIKLFEVYVSGFIPPEHEPSLPSQLIGEALDVARREHELDKRERLLHLRALQIGATAHQRQGHSRQGTQVPVNQTSLNRVSSIVRPTPIASRSSWRWTIMSDIDSEDDSVDVLHPTVHTQNSIRASHSVAAKRTIIPDPNARLEELRNMVLNLQASVEALTLTVKQQDVHHLPTQVPSTTNSTHEINV